MSDAPQFKPAQGIPGLLFVPSGCGKKKHRCPDCFDCQWCSDSRCAGCQGWCKKTNSPGDEGAGRDPNSETP